MDNATNFIKTVEQHQHRKIACLEEIAYLNGWISKEEVLKVYEEKTLISLEWKKVMATYPAAMYEIKMA